MSIETPPVGDPTESNDPVQEPPAEGADIKEEFPRKDDDADADESGQ